jgi:hypothetical protein
METTALCAFCDRNRPEDMFSECVQCGAEFCDKCVGCGNCETAVQLAVSQLIDAIVKDVMWANTSIRSQPAQ